MNFFRKCVVIIISSICFLPIIKTCNFRYNSINSLLPESASDDILENEEDSDIRVRRDDSLFGLEAIEMSEEQTDNLRMGRKVIFSNDTRISENKTRPSQITKMLNAAYYSAKDAYMYQQALKKRFKGVVPVGCHLIEGLPPAAGGADNAAAPAAPAEETTTTAPPARRRKRDDETTTTATPAAEAPAGATTPPPGAAAAATTTVITTTTPKPVSLVCPPSTTTPTTTIPTTTPPAAAAAAPAAPADATTTTLAPP